jgi:hypothetical protein
MLKVADLLSRFPQYKSKYRTYDNDYQILFHPIPEEYEFTALTARLGTDPEVASDPGELLVNNITFCFG